MRLVVSVAWLVISPGNSTVSTRSLGRISHAALNALANDLHETKGLWIVYCDFEWCLAPPRLHVHLVIYFSNPWSSSVGIIARSVLLYCADMLR